MILNFDYFNTEQTGGGGGDMKIHLIPVTELPDATASTMGSIYLVPSTDPKQKNIKDEYVTIDNGAEAETRYTWECIGSTKADLSNYYTKTETNTALAAKQGTLTAGTGISISNDVISATGGGASVTKLTQAQYDALETKDPDTIYDITDAAVVDLSDYATQDDLDTLSATVGTKATAQSIGIQTGYALPTWNEQGVITGTKSNLNTVSFYFNGNPKIIPTTSGTSTVYLYGATTAGSAGQLLTSAGSGAPQWSMYKLAFMTAAEYAALSTKDSTTLYIVTD